jgi:acetyltransferase
MSVHQLRRIFSPERVAVIGASPRKGSVGDVVMDNLAQSGFAGAVHPVNPRYRAIHAHEASHSIKDIGSTVDLAVVCTPAATVPDVVRECGEAGVAGALVLSAGFREIGPEGVELERRLAEVAESFADLRVIGPNCLGLMVPRLGLNASFAPARPRPGSVALVSQSGALATAMLDWADEQGIGFSVVISAGNMVDVDFGDLIDHLAQDPETDSLMLYVESITRPRKFMSAARAFTRGKPIVAYKAGRFAESAKAAVSHTGAMAGADDVYAAALRRAGIVRVGQIGDVFDVAELLARPARPRRSALGVVTNAGGPGVMAVDELLSRGGSLAVLGEATLARLAKALPPAAARENPVDVLGDADAERYRTGLGALLDDEGVAAVLVMLTPQAMTDPDAVADAVCERAAETRKPVLAAWMGGAAVRDARLRLERGGVASYQTPEQAVGAFMYLVDYARNREMLYETPRSVPVSFTLERGKVRGLLSGLVFQDRDVLGDAQSKALLDAYGIPGTSPVLARTVDEAVRAADEIGYPVVLKVHSDDISHKSDVDGVIPNVQDEAGVRRGFEQIMARVSERAPDAQVRGVTVQEMATGPGEELILGARKDPTFGAVIMVGAGGVATEVLGDTVLELPPLNERLALGMLTRLRIWPLLTGHRGQPAADLESLLEILMRFSYLVADCPEVSEIEINPLFAGPERTVALDARMVIDPHVSKKGVPYEHLAIRPYPDELITRATLRDGTEVTLRPIRPEDERMWQDMLSAASADSRRARFRGVFRHTSHQMAIRYCFIDYDREMAIVAEIEEASGPALIGVGRLVADPSCREAEYAVFVTDPWQGRGLSVVLTDRCLEIARAWGLERVWAITQRENRRMLAVFESRGFTVEHTDEPGVMAASLEVSGA